jgi:isopentenyl-diphosphate Delta-isomerase
MTCNTLENVVLVDEQDNEIGSREKLITHLEGKLHRAVSVFLFNENGQLLLQQRAFSKYHSGGLWSNTCCGHPRPGESPVDAAERRLSEEMGICCELEKLFHFIYRAPLDNQITEYEFDHVFVGHFEGNPDPNPEEAHAWKWVDMDSLLNDIDNHPERYTVWFKIVLQNYLNLPDQPSLVRKVEK